MKSDAQLTGSVTAGTDASVFSETSFIPASPPSIDKDIVNIVLVCLFIRKLKHFMRSCFMFEARITLVTSEQDILRISRLLRVALPSEPD